MAKSIQLQIAEISGGGQIPLDQVKGSGGGGGVTSLDALTGDLLLVSGDGSIVVQTPISSVIDITTPAVAAAAAAQAAAMNAQNDATGAAIAAAAAQATANTAETDAQTGITNAATAQTAANIALVNAAAAQTTANTGVANAATAQSTANDALALTNPVTIYPGLTAPVLPDANTSIGIAPSGTAADATHGSIYYCSNASAPRTFTLDPTGALPGEELWIIFAGGVGFAITIVDGGPLGGPIFVCPAGGFGNAARRQAVFRLNIGGTNWLFDHVVRINT